MRHISLSEAAPHLKGAFSPILPERRLIGDVCPLSQFSDSRFIGSRSVRVGRVGNYLAMVSSIALVYQPSMSAQNTARPDRKAKPQKISNDQAYIHGHQYILTISYYDVSVCRLFRSPRQSSRSERHRRVPMRGPEPQAMIVMSGTARKNLFL